jgi:hypothetical protein
MSDLKNSWFPSFCIVVTYFSHLHSVTCQIFRECKICKGLVIPISISVLSSMRNFPNNRYHTFFIFTLHVETKECARVTKVLSAEFHFAINKVHRWTTGSSVHGNCSCLRKFYLLPIFMWFSNIILYFSLTFTVSVTCISPNVLVLTIDTKILACTYFQVFYAQMTVFFPPYNLRQTLFLTSYF